MCQGKDGCICQRLHHIANVSNMVGWRRAGVDVFAVAQPFATSFAEIALVGWRYWLCDCVVYSRHQILALTLHYSLHPLAFTVILRRVFIHRSHNQVNSGGWLFLVVLGHD